MRDMSYDSTGKVDLNTIYNEENPVSYFSTLSALDYRIPEEGKSIFKRLIGARRKAAGAEDVKLIDVGCSYGVNAALLKHGMSMEELYRLYGDEGADTPELVARDQSLYADPADEHLQWVGLDRAEQAVAYALETGMMDAGVAVSLEHEEPEGDDARAIANADMIISTGCIGYVTEATLRRLVESGGEHKPWMAHFVLRMFPYEPVEEMAREHGYVTEKLEGLFPQRRFASLEERKQVLANLEKAGIDARGAETSGWYFAELYVSRPEEDARRAPLDDLITGSLRPPFAA